jgi:hypothetical protein
MLEGETEVQGTVFSENVIPYIQSPEPPTAHFDTLCMHMQE